MLMGHYIQYVLTYQLKTVSNFLSVEKKNKTGPFYSEKDENQCVGRFWNHLG